MLDGINNNYSAQKVKGIPKWLVVLMDIAMANLGLYFAFIFASGELQGFQIATLVILFPMVSLATVFIFSGLGLYSTQRLGFMAVIRSMVTGVLGLTLFSLIFAFWTRTLIFQRTLFFAAPLFQLLLLLSWRLLYWRLEMWISGQKRLLVIGNRFEANQVLAKILSLPGALFEIVAVIDTADIASLPLWLGKADSVMITGSLGMELKNRVLRLCFDQETEVFIVPDLYEIMLTRAAMTQVNDIPVIECHDMKLTFQQFFIKRCFDLLTAFVLLLPAIPLIAFSALVITLTSGGPVFYRQERVGLNGKLFTLYKLRTMINDAEEVSGPVFSTEEDDRVTPIGRFLRATRIDELPQLYNVLKGDLSIVGPRPERPFFVKQFQEEMDDYKLRHMVKPGITGLAQVAGFYSTNTNDKLRYDLYYITDYSLLLDFRILLQTIPALFNREASRGISISKQLTQNYPGLEKAFTAEIRKKNK